MKKIGAAYIRVSDERQDEYSPDSQIKLVHKYAAEHGYVVPEEYIFFDDGISAKTAERRREFNRMIAIAKSAESPFCAIFVWKYSRFARNQEESIVYKSLLKKRGIDVVSISEPVPEGPWGGLIERIIEWMDEYYLINLSVEVVRGMTERVSRGEPVGIAPYGYKNAKGEKRFETDPERAAIVQEIFERYDRGDGMRNIAMELNAKGVTTRSGKKIENRFVEYILYNPTYIGKIRWSPNGEMATKRKFDEENFIIVAGSHEPLVSEELWERVQNRLQEQERTNAKHRRKTPEQSPWMLQGLVKCSSCGATLSRTTNKTPGMQCSKYIHGTCSESHYIGMKKAEELILQGLEVALQNDDFEIVQKKEAEPVERRSADKQIEAEKKKLERIKAAYMAGVDTIEEYRAQKKAITARIEKLMAEQKPKEPVQRTEYKARIYQIIQYIKDPETSKTAKNEALKSIIEKIIFDRKTESFRFFFFG